MLGDFAICTVTSRNGVKKVVCVVVLGTTFHIAAVPLPASTSIVATTLAPTPVFG